MSSESINVLNIKTEKRHNAEATHQKRRMKRRRGRRRKKGGEEEKDGVII